MFSVIQTAASEPTFTFALHVAMTCLLSLQQNFCDVIKGTLNFIKLADSVILCEQMMFTIHP